MTLTGEGCCPDSVIVRCSSRRIAAGLEHIHVERIGTGPLPRPGTELGAGDHPQMSRLMLAYQPRA
jgi:hypothetical protein